MKCLFNYTSGDAEGLPPLGVYLSFPSWHCRALQLRPVSEPKEAKHTPQSVLSQAVGMNATQIEVCGLVVVHVKNLQDILLAYTNL